METYPITKFPRFREVCLSDRDLFTKFTHEYPPYSDYNFTNLWSWDVLESRKFAELNGNLVILFSDYRTTKPMLSFIGQNMPTETATTILEHTKRLITEPELKFITEETAMLLQGTDLCVSEDNTNHDYIFLVKDIANPQSNNLKSKHRLANKFISNYPHIILVTQELSDPVTQKKVFDVLYRWEQNKKIDNKAYEIIYEEIALRRIMSSAKIHDLILTCIYEGEVMIAFSIDEILNNNYAISHFIKADIKYKGVYEYLNQAVANILLNSDVRYWNWEQDLNLEGLRNLKMSYRPVSFLKKYAVSLPN